MDYSQVGLEIKFLRKKQGISQKELSEGICTQAQISKIESGEVHPFSSTLFLLAKRLGVDVNHFYKVGFAPQYEYIKEVELQIRKAISHHNYEDVMDLIKVEKKNPIYQNHIEYKQFLLWHEGICAYHLLKNNEKSLQLLDEALDLTKHGKKILSEREVEILNSTGIIYLETKTYDSAIRIFTDALLNLKQITYITNEKIMPRICYNYSRALTLNKEYELAIDIADQGITWCMDHQLLYQLGELYFQKGLNLHRLNEVEKSYLFFNKAITIFELQGKESLVNHIKDKFF
jgi:transcriptional regulator with XRE-family HTH domain